MREYSYKEILSDSTLVTWVNKAYHDVESETYEEIHPEIFLDEQKSWMRIVNRFIAPKKENSPSVYLDIGTGTGFVVECLSSTIRLQDKMIFSDLSAKMLEVCKKKFIDQKWNKEFIVNEATSIPLESNSVDVITVNSVLHHIHDTAQFFLECRRILKKGGVLVIKHEPNVRFAKNIFLRNLYFLLQKIRLLRHNLKKSKNKFGSQNIFYEKVRSNLLKEGLNLSNLSNRQIGSIVDIHSPTALGSIDKTRGFDPYAVWSEYFEVDNLLHIHTYGFLGKISESNNKVKHGVSKVFGFIFPKDGYFFDIVFEKN